MALGTFSPPPIALIWMPARHETLATLQPSLEDGMDAFWGTTFIALGAEVRGLMFTEDDNRSGSLVAFVPSKTQKDFREACYVPFAGP